MHASGVVLRYSPMHRSALWCPESMAERVENIVKESATTRLHLDVA